MDKIKTKLMILFLFLFQGVSLQARQPYHATVIVDGISATVSAPNLVDLKRDLRSGSLEALIPVYTPTSPAAIDINLRGIDILGSFAANSTTFVIDIPQTGTTTSFTGSTRAESLALFKDFIQDGGNKHNLLKAYAKFSPIDPIAGNPNSLMAQMAQADYLMGLLSPLSGCDCSWSAQPILHQFQTGANTTRAFSKGFETTAVTTPLRYSYSPDRHWALIIDAPFTYFRNGGASSVFGSLGFGLRLPITNEWSLTSIIRAGSGGSVDLCTAGTFISTGLTSVYEYKLCDYVLALTNYAGYITSTNLWLTGINFNYHLHNYIFKNGLSITSCGGLTICDRPVNVSLSFVDSYFAKDRLFIRHYDEFTATLITNYVLPWLDYDCFTIGFSYQFGEKHYKGYCVNMAYQF